MAEADLAEISGKLDTLIKLMAASITVGKKQIDQIRILYCAGITPKQVAEMLGTTGNTVNVALSNLRKKGIID